MKLNFLPLLAACAFFATSLTVRAETVDDLAALGQKNVGEDVMLAVVNNAKNDFTLSAADIIKLKNANVPNSVITAMLKHKGVAAAAPAAPAVPAAPAPAAPAVAAAPVPGDGTLDIENLDNRIWTYRYEPALKTLWIIQPVPQDNRGNIAANGNVNLRMAADNYKIRYAGQEDGPSVTVNGGQKSQLLISRVNTDQLEALYVSVFENGVKRPGGRLVVLRENGAIKHDSQAEPPPYGAAPVYADAPVAGQPVQPGPTIVEQAPPTVVYSNPPVVVSPPPVVYYPPYRYYGPYYPHGVVNFGYYGGGHHSRYGVGLGFGF